MLSFQMIGPQRKVYTQLSEHGFWRDCYLPAHLMTEPDITIFDGVVVYLKVRGDVHAVHRM